MEQDLSNVKYVGPATINRLAEHGISSVEQLAAMSVEALAAIPGIGESTAPLIIASAQEILAPAIANIATDIEPESEPTEVVADAEPAEVADDLDPEFEVVTEEIIIEMDSKPSKKQKKAAKKAKKALKKALKKAKKQEKKAEEAARKAEKKANKQAEKLAKQAKKAKKIEQG
jgi:transcription termination factor NusA